MIAGRFGGRTLVAPPGTATRPTGDRVREALFSILGSVDGARVLDLFAGSGALGIEALSRGAAEATLVDPRRPAIAAIRRNLDGIDATAEVRRSARPRSSSSARSDARQYDLVFLDPPYRPPATSAGRFQRRCRRCWHRARGSLPRATGGRRWSWTCRCSTSAATATP